MRRQASGFRTQSDHPSLRGEPHNTRLLNAKPVYYATMDKNAFYRSGMETADALDDMDMPEQAETVRSFAKKMRDVETELEALIAESR